jgi:hypothetical protein
MFPEEIHRFPHGAGRAARVTRLLEMLHVWVQMMELRVLDDVYGDTPFGKPRVHNAIGNRYINPAS